MVSSPATDVDPTSRTRILAAATHLFVADGYRSTSMKAIATEVGISPPALYWHFPSKQDLFLASMEALLDDFIESVESSLTGTSPLELVAQFTRAHVLWRLQKNSAAVAYSSTVGVRDLVHTLPPTFRQSLVAKQRQHLDRLRQILVAGVKDGSFRVSDVRLTSFAIITMCDYAHTWFDPEGEWSPADVAERYVALTLAMIGGPTP